MKLESSYIRLRYAFRKHCINNESDFNNIININSN